MGRLQRDFVYVVRSVRARPCANAFTALVLAVGSGLLSTVFALADPFLLRPLPYPHQAGLVVIRVVSRSAVPSEHPNAAPVTVVDWAQRRDLFAGLAGYRDAGSVRVRFGGRAAILRTAEVTGGFFTLLGVPVPGAGQSADTWVMTAGSAGRLAGSNSELTDRTLARQDGGSVAVAAVLPGNFLFPSPDVVFPFDAFVHVPDREMRIFEGPAPATVIARLQPNVSAAQAAAALALSAETFGSRVDVTPLSTRMKSRRRPLALGALAAGLLIMLVCAANVANLVLARNLSRRGEFVILEFLGARQRDVMRLVLVELALMVAAGIALGLLLARLALVATTLVAPVDYMALGHPSVTMRVVAFCCVVGLLVIALGALPATAAWNAARGRHRSRPAASERRYGQALRLVMASIQTMLAVVLLTGAVLFVRSYLNLIEQNTGFNSDAYVVTASYPPDDIGPRLQHEIEETLRRLRGLPGVEAVGAARGAMVDRLLVFGGLRVAGQMLPAESKRVTPGYFEAIGTAVVAGRALRADDARSAVVVNESLARQVSPDGRALGTPVGSATAIVGIVRDTFNLALDVGPQPTVYSLLDNVEECIGTGCDNRISYVLRRRAGGATDLLAARIVVGLNPDIVILEASSIGDRLTGSVKDRSFATLVVGLFAVGALSVCVAGLAGMVVFVVARRTRELAIRITVGATPGSVIVLVVKEVSVATIAGMVGGMVLGRWVSRLAEAFAYQVQPSDWWSPVSAASAMMVVAALSLAFPLRRAIRLPPTAALRVE